MRLLHTSGQLHRGASGKFKDEIVPVEITDRKGNVTLFSEDEEYKNVNFEKIPTLKPTFTERRDGHCGECLNVK